MLLLVLLQVPAQVHLHQLFLAVRHLRLLVIVLVHLRLLLQVGLLPLVQVMFLLDLLVRLHLEPLVALLAALLLIRHPPIQVVLQVALQVLPLVVLLAHPLRIPHLEAQVPRHQMFLVHPPLMRLVEVPVRRLVTRLPQALVSLRLEVSTLVVRHPTVLL